MTCVSERSGSASSGVLTSDQTPMPVSMRRRQQHQKPVARRTVDEAGDHRLASGAGCVRKALQGGAQIALGIDQEIGAGDDFVAGFDAFGDLDPIVALGAERAPRAARSGLRRDR